MPIVQGSTIVPDGATVTLDASMRVVPTPGSGFLMGAAAGSSGGAPSTHGATHVVGDDPISVSSVTGNLPVANGGTHLTTFPAGALLYGSALDLYAALTAPAVASVLTHSGTGGMPAWVAALAKAQQHASTAYVDAANVFTDTQTVERAAGAVAFQMRRTGDSAPRRRMLDDGTDEWGNGSSAADVLVNRQGAGMLRLRSGTNANITLTLRPQNTVGGAGGFAGITMFDGAASAFSMVGNFNAASGLRNIGIDAFSDRDGNRLPYYFSTASAGGTSTRALTLFAGADAGKAAFGTALGVNLGTGVVPSATVHALNTSAGVMVEALRLANNSNTAGSGSSLNFHAGTAGVQNIARIYAVQLASNVGDLVLEAQAVAGAGPLERLRVRGNGPLEIPNITAFPAGNPAAGKVWLASIGGVLKTKNSAGATTILAA